ncbi:unnamed protein product [Protopolystoma xenopodis]|uniref:Uncharacterized protein n=1 Tax=Protopolystoma xenopodis TaxID=117903 RepID=A0A3S5AB71_9PLAT|nr:unnamed protein product [Protopolystoma xenopodis]
MATCIPSFCIHQCFCQFFYNRVLLFPRLTYSSFQYSICVKISSTQTLRLLAYSIIFLYLIGLQSSVRAFDGLVQLDLTRQHAALLLNGQPLVRLSTAAGSTTPAETSTPPVCDPGFISGIVSGQVDSILCNDVIQATSDTIVGNVACGAAGHPDGASMIIRSRSSSPSVCCSSLSHAVSSTSLCTSASAIGAITKPTAALSSSTIQSFGWDRCQQNHHLRATPNPIQSQEKHQILMHPAGIATPWASLTAGLDFNGGVYTCVGPAGGMESDNES